MAYIDIHWEDGATRYFSQNLNIWVVFIFGNLYTFIVIVYYYNITIGMSDNTPCEFERRRTMSRMYWVSFALGVVVSCVGIAYSVVTGNWGQTTNVLGGIGMVCMVGPLFGGYGRSGNNSGRGRVGDGFRNQKERNENRLQGLRFGLFILFLGVPMLLSSIAIYFIYPQ